MRNEVLNEFFVLFLTICFILTKISASLSTVFGMNS